MEKLIQISMKTSFYVDYERKREKPETLIGFELD
jgi:hypothetical protein